LAKVVLDFNDYPDIQGGTIVWVPPPESLKRVPYLYERAAACLHALFDMESYTERDGYPTDMHVAASIRASLVDFVGIEEAVQSASYDFKIISSKCSLLHFMRLLRNYHVHLGFHPISKAEVAVIYNGFECSMNVPIIDNLDAKKFMQLDAVKKYKNYDFNDIQTMVEMFKEQQARLGVYEILRRGVLRLIEDVEKVI
jgi:hypothetical protein